MNSFPRWLITPLVLTIWALALTTALLLPSWLDPDNPGDGRVRGTIRVALACWFVAVMMMPGLDRAGWQKGGWEGVARWALSLGWIAYVVHVGVAFHYAFGWSHAAAMAHTQARSGVGEGIFISHAFTLVWGVDSVWWWLASAAYAGRSVWWGLFVHGFMGFVIFNGTVVYETGLVRWVGAAAFAVLGVRVANGCRIAFFRRIPGRG